VADKEYIPMIARNMSNPEYRKQLQNEQALQGVYPEALFAGAGRAALSGIRSMKKPDPKVRSVKIGENIADEASPAWKNVGFGPSPKESLDALRKREKLDAFNEMSRSADMAGAQATRRFLGEVAGQRMPSLNESDSYKKGGKTVSQRADGIAQRGKTRGRLV
jgi:hypothetical protein